MPLLLRKERGDLQLTKLKMSQTDLDRQNETLKIKNKIKAYHVEINNLHDQISLYKETVNNYFALLNGEKRKFEEGESSLFIVNSRENSLITAEVKLIELIAKYQKAQAGLEMAIGGSAENNS
jgi:outer membrane protein TolC